MKKTLTLIAAAGLLAAGGAMAQSASGDTSMTTQPGSPSQQLNSNSGGVPSTLPGSASVGTADPQAQAPATSADSASSTSVMGAGPSTTVVVPATTVAVVPAVPVVVDQPVFGRGNVGSGAVDTGNGTLEGNGGPYDDGWWGPRQVYVYVPR
jgi:hypothetical protein